MDIFFFESQTWTKKKTFSHLRVKRDLPNKNKLTNVIFKRNPVSKTVEVNFLNMQQGLEEKSSLYFVCPFLVNWVTFFSCF